MILPWAGLDTLVAIIWIVHTSWSTSVVLREDPKIAIAEKLQFARSRPHSRFFGIYDQLTHDGQPKDLIGRTARGFYSTYQVLITSASALWEVPVDGTNLHRLLDGRTGPPFSACCVSCTPDGQYFTFRSRADMGAPARR
jgi:hypothetical protein